MVEKLRLIISKIFVGFLFALVIFSSSLWEDKAPFVTSLLFLLGAFLVGIASMGRLWCSVYIAGYKKGHLVTQGPYSMCRNPLYFFSLVGGLGVGFASETILIPLLMLIAFVGYYPFVIKSEETEMIKLHKNEYENYLKSVPVFFPKISLLSEPQEYTVKPIIFRQHMFDTLLFIWLLGIMVVLQELHELKIIPALFKTY
jgi:protein-S-isoprenylcysteine O-methyltransferase Ste14